MIKKTSGNARLSHAKSNKESSLSSSTAEDDAYAKLAQHFLSPDLNGAIRLHVLRCHNGITALQASLDATSGSNQLGATIALRKHEMEMNGGVPPRVPPKIWRRAIGMDCKAIAEANSLDPGCIYLNERIVQAMSYKTTVAVYGYNKEGGQYEGSEVESARNWLCTALELPKSVSGRSVLGVIHIELYETLLFEIYLLHFAYLCFKKQNTSSEQAVDQMEQLFPDFSELKSDWQSLILGRKETPEDVKKKANQKIVYVVPSNAAELIMGEITGYSDRAIRKHLTKREGNPKAFNSDRENKRLFYEYAAKDIASELVKRAMQKA